MKADAEANDAADAIEAAANEPELFGGARAATE